MRNLKQVLVACLLPVKKHKKRLVLQANQVTLNKNHQLKSHHLKNHHRVAVVVALEIVNRPLHVALNEANRILI